MSHTLVPIQVLVIESYCQYKKYYCSKSATSPYLSKENQHSESFYMQLEPYTFSNSNINILFRFTESTIIIHTDCVTMLPENSFTCWII